MLNINISNSSSNNKVGISKVEISKLKLANEAHYKHTRPVTLNCSLSRVCL